MFFAPGGVKIGMMSDMVHLVGISGSLRKESYNTKLLHQLSTLLPNDTAFEILSIASLPLYNADLDIPASEERPASVKHFREVLAKADGVVLVSPEYNYSIPGGLKNAIDWASRGDDAPLLRKPVALMGATLGHWGTVRMQQAFLPVFQYLDMKPVHKPEVLVAQANTKFDEKGNLNDEATKEILRKKLLALREMIIKTR
ncbi:NADPH-dependent FMN reductase [uncultured Chitinophaga sp.]|uniref:NADPH-dependent FMN reductase n=1 Tax=uncultured Chitinophaga sp. TaxID=339340 RepID=UPI0025E4AA88|nr:NAD(P)H-dependent oxidoreductase [uncultured Chitinophaga sp.]